MDIKQKEPKMQIELTIPANVIAMLRYFSGNKDVRYYLNGICLEIGATELLLIACNGYSVGVYRLKSPQPGITEPLTGIIIPNGVLKGIKPKGEVRITIDATAEGSVRPVTVTYNNTSVSGLTLDGKYPDWRRPIPSRVSGETAQFNPQFVGDLAKAYLALHPEAEHPAVRIGHNGQQAALLNLEDENFVGVLMPLREVAHSTPRTPPDWWADKVHGV